MKMKTTKKEKQTVYSVDLCITSMYGPSHEEWSVFLQVPAMARSMHPRDLEDSLFLKMFIFYKFMNNNSSVHVCVWTHQRTLTLLTHLRPGIWHELICSSSHGRILILSTGILSCAHT